MGQSSPAKGRGSPSEPTPQISTHFISIRSLQSCPDPEQPGENQLPCAPRAPRRAYISTSCSTSPSGNGVAPVTLPHCCRPKLSRVGQRGRGGGLASRAPGTTQSTRRRSGGAKSGLGEGRRRRNAVRWVHICTEHKATMRPLIIQFMIRMYAP